MIIVIALLISITVNWFMICAECVGPFAILGCLPATIFLLWLYRGNKVAKYNRTISSLGKTEDEFAGEVERYVKKRRDVFFINASNISEYKVECVLGILYRFAETVGLEIVVKQCGAPDDDHPNADGVYMDAKECWKMENGRKTILCEQ